LARKSSWATEAAAKSEKSYFCIYFLPHAPMNRALVCNQAGMVYPVINRDRCIGDADCVAVCPYGVLALRALHAEQLVDLPSRTREGLAAHGNSQAVATSAELCRACGLCVAACGQNAIILRGRFEANCSDA
jgi:NAD-dependent dihydropyrimidine dehydrogenase PreA subunit